MTFQSISDILPGVYRDFLPKFFKSAVPKENAATCADCAMFNESEVAISKGAYFSKDSKCCTHYPNLPNYSVGGLLSDKSPDLETGRSRIRKTIQSRIGVTPHGILRPRKYLLLLKNTEKEFFGRSKLLICPFYERGKGICTIRPFWDAICNTWFCKYSAGEDGRLFWVALRKYMSSLEMTLVQYTLHRLGWEPHEILLSEFSNIPLTVREVDDQLPSEKTYRDLWRGWINREEDFYKEAYRLVMALTPKAFEKIAGISQKILLKEVKARRKNLIRPRLPKILKRNPNLHVEKKGDDSYYLVGYLALDPFEVSKRVYDLLDFFDGRRTVKEACRLIRQHTGAVPDEDLLTSLCQYRILLNMEEA